MALRGETIGQAYVRILADGSGFSDSAKDEIRQHQDDFGDAGEDASDHFWKGYEKENEKNAETSLDKTLKSFDKSRGRFAAQGELSGSSFMDGVREALEGAFPNDVGAAIGRNLSEGLESGAIRGTAGIKARLADIGPEVAKATKQITDEQANQWRIGYNQINRETEAGLRRVSQTIRQGAARVDVVKALFGESEADSKMYTESLVRQFGRLRIAVADFDKQVLKGGGARNALRTRLVQIAEAMPEAVRGTAAFEQEMRRLLGVLTPSGNLLGRWRDQIVKSGDATGRLFGKGSRNNALNFFGGLVTLLPSVISGFSKLTESVGGAVSRFNDLRKSEGLMSALQSSFGAFAKSAPGAIIAVGGAITSISVLLPSFGAAISGVTGLVLALAGSLGFALVGALGAVAGALVPFAAAIGVAALAMTGLGKKNSGLTKLKDDFKDLQEIAAKGVFGKDGAGLANLEPILKGITPLVDTISKALGGLLTQLGEFGKSKGFSDLMSSISKEIGPMVTALGTIGGKFAVGIGQAFVALGPIINQFLGWLDDVADKFVAFGQGGQKSGLAKWFDDAWDSAKIVGGLILNIIDLIGQLFSAGKGTGDSIFQSISDKVKEIVEWLSKPEGQKALADWFDFAKRIAGELGGVVTKVVEFVDALDTPESRKMLEFLLQGFQRLIGVATALTPLFLGISGAIMKIGDAWLAVGGWIKTAAGAVKDFFAGFGGKDSAIGKVDWSGLFSGIGAALSTAGQAIGDFFTVTIPGFWNSFWDARPWKDADWSDIFAPLKDIGWDVVEALLAPFVWLMDQLVGHSIIPDMINAIGAWFMKLPGMVASAIAGVMSAFGTWAANIILQMPAIIAAIVNGFKDIGSKIWAAAGKVAPGFTAWISGVVKVAITTATAVAKAFSGLAKKIISGAGSIASSFANWVSSLPGKAKTAANNIINAFGNLASRIISKAGSIASAFAKWASSLPGKAKALANDIAKAFSGLAKKAFDKAGSLASEIASWGKGVAGKAKSVASDIVSAFSGLASRIVKAIGTVVPNWALPKALRKAAGGIISSPVVSWVGEEGPEAIIPLNRNLSRVDPSVRALSAIAQGLPIPRGSEIDVKGSGTGGGGMQVTIVTPTKDPYAVAAEVFTRFTAASYV